ncbi:MAG: hypothetical protein O9340_00255 [Cyclobacteriaceae bacterium]|jgi:hypothetical protein|nr:hypothetical protein [Cyclobacteriaceae bacterium]
MKRAIFILFFLSFSCVPTEYKYFVRTYNELQNINWERNILNYLPLSDDIVYESTVIRRTVSLLQTQSFSKLKVYLSQQQEKDSDFYFAQTLYLMAKADYSNAWLSLEAVDKNKYEPIQSLISIDLTYELNKKRGFNDYVRILDSYQTLLDNYPNDNALRNIIALRTRYIRYN